MTISANAPITAVAIFVMLSSYEELSHRFFSSYHPLIIMSGTTPIAQDPLQFLKEEFRRHLEFFYAQLKLAPPYESVEKAIRTLTTRVHALPKDEQARIVADPALQWQQFRDAFDTSGLVKKHRGIIAGLARNRTAVNLPIEYDHFLSLFLT